MLSNCGAGEDLEKTPESPLNIKETKPVNPKGNQSWIFIGRDWRWRWSSNTWATWFKELTHWKRPWCWDRLKAGGEGDNREWDDWLASPTCGLEFEQALGTSERQGSLFSRNPWGCKESDTTEPLNWTGNKLRNSVKIVFYNRCCLWLFELQMNIPCW